MIYAEKKLRAGQPTLDEWIVVSHSHEKITHQERGGQAFILNMIIQWALSRTPWSLLSASHPTQQRTGGDTLRKWLASRE